VKKIAKTLLFSTKEIQHFWRCCHFSL